MPVSVSNAAQNRDEVREQPDTFSFSADYVGHSVEFSVTEEVKSLPVLSPCVRVAGSSEQPAKSSCIQEEYRTFVIAQIKCSSRKINYHA